MAFVAFEMDSPLYMYIYIGQYIVIGGVHEKEAVQIVQVYNIIVELEER